GALAFGLFGVSWSLQISFGNLANLATTAQVAQLCYLLFLAFLVPAPYLLIEFAAAQAPDPRAPKWLVPRIVFGAIGVCAAALLFVLACVTVWGAATARRAWQRWERESEARLLRWTPTLILTALALGMLEGVVNVGWNPYFYTIGLWRLAGVAVIAYGLARW